jgi:hypothetical protein
VEAKRCDGCGKFETATRGWFTVAWPDVRDAVLDLCSWDCLSAVDHAMFDRRARIDVMDTASTAVVAGQVTDMLWQVGGR